MRRPSYRTPTRTVATLVAAGALTLTPLASASAADEPADLILTQREYRHPAPLEQALSDYGLDVDVDYLAPGHVTVDRVPVARVLTKAERAQLPPGVTHIYNFAWDPGSCPVGDGLEVLVTGLDDHHATVPAGLLDLVMQDGDQVLIPRPNEADPKTMVAVVGSPQDMACLSG